MLLTTAQDMDFGIALAHTHTTIWPEVAIAADRSGFDSVWLPDHLVFASQLAVDAYPGAEQPAISAATPLYDCPAYLSYLAAITTRVRLGTYVYLYALRHPLIAARAFATADILSSGRIEVGVGAGWLASEWEAAEVPFGERGGRLDEAIAVSRRLWTESNVEHRGRYWSWAPVGFEPKPVAAGGPPILVGGESDRALRRAAQLGDGWMSMPHTLDTIKPQIDRLRRHLSDAGRDASDFHITACSIDPPEPSEVERWSEAGVDRLIVRPWERTSDTIPALKRFAERYADHLAPV